MATPAFRKARNKSRKAQKRKRQQSAQRKRELHLSVARKRPPIPKAALASEGENMTLYHFTCLMWLPEIIAGGITRGEVPINHTDPHLKLPNAANLTSNPDRIAQHCWHVAPNILNKLRIRLTVAAPKGDIVTFEEVRKHYQMEDWWADLIAPKFVRTEWFYAFGGVAADRIIRVEVAKRPGRYEIHEGQALQKLLTTIEKEKDKFVFGFAPDGARACGLREGVHDSWLLDGPAFMRHRAA